jgi:hypothetical protein
MALAQDQLIEAGDGYGLFGAGYTTFISPNSPCKNAVNLNLNYGSMVMDDKAVLDFGFNCNIGLHTNDSWVYNAFDKKPPFFSNTGSGGISYTALVALMPLVMDKSKYAITVGPEVGAGYVTLPGMEANDGNAYGYKDPAMITLNYGVKAYLFIGHRFYIKGEYLNCIQNTVTTSINDNPVSDVRINYSQLQLGIGYKFFEY